ncbi:MAG: hypothetical protein ACTTIF_03380 [Prevotella sp.]
METAQEYNLISNSTEELVNNGSKRTSNINNTVAVLLCSGLFSLSLPSIATSAQQNSLFSYSVPGNNKKKYEKNIRRDERNIIELKKMNIVSDIRDLSLLDNDWDGYGAIKVLPRCISNAINIINAKIISCNYINDIYANPNGTVSIIWENEFESNVGLEIGEKEMSFYYLNGNKQEIVNHVPLNEESYTQLSKLLCKL